MSTHFNQHSTQKLSLSTLNLSQENNEALTLLKQDFQKCIDEGVATYKSLMDKILEPKIPFKDSQLQHYHDSIVKLIRNGFQESYSKINTNVFPLNISVKFQHNLLLAQMRLESLMKVQYNEIYLRKHEFEIDNIVTKLKGITDEVTKFYDSQADGTQLDKKRRNEVKNWHNKLVKSAQEMLERRLKTNNFENETFWKYELNQNLKERLEDVLEDHPEETSFNARMKIQIQGIVKGKTLLAKMIQSKKTRQNGFFSAPNWDLKDAVNTHFTQHQKKPAPTAGASVTTKQMKPPLSSKIKQESAFGEQGYRRTMDIGIYFDHNAFRIMLFRPSKSFEKNALNFEEIERVSPEIFFSEKKILLGEETTCFRFNIYKYFNIFQLVASFKPSAPSHIPIGDMIFTLCTHQIIAAFFLEVFGRLELNNDAKIGNIVITVPFHAFTAVKERIQKAGKIAGFSQIQIQSSLLTTAISTLDAPNLDMYSVEIVHSSECSLQLSLLHVGDEMGILNTSKCTLGESTRFDICINYGLQHKVRFLLEENYGDDNQTFQVGLYELTIVMDSNLEEEAMKKKNQNVNVEIMCSEGNDGGINVDVVGLDGLDAVTTTVEMIRVDDSTCSPTCRKLDSAGLKSYLESWYINRD